MPHAKALGSYIRTYILYIHTYYTYIHTYIHTYIVHVHAELATLEWPVDKPSQNPGENTACVCVCVHACACVCLQVLVVCVCVCVCVCVVCVCAHMHPRACLWNTVTMLMEHCNGNSRLVSYPDKLIS